MQQRELFRSEAVSHQATKIYGTVFINVPLQYSIVSCGLGLLLIGFIIFTLVTDYADHYMVRGYLNTKSGVVHVHPLRPGVIRKQLITVGQQVQKGDILYVVDNSYEQFSHYPSIEYRELQAKLAAIKQDLIDKAQQIHNIEPLLKKHYISLSAYHILRNELKELESRRHDLLISLIRYEQSRTYTIRAPIDGEISSIEYELGQVINPMKPLLTIVPSSKELIAQLYIPVSKSGFINQGESVALRYDAYPYQHFGVATGHIVSITHTILMDRNEDKPLTVGEPYYKATVALDKQTINLYGHQHLLQQGMTCTVMISGIRKKIWQWIIEPLT